jgi:hypothetical protein
MHDRVRLVPVEALPHDVLLWVDGPADGPYTIWVRNTPDALAAAEVARQTLLSAGPSAAAA